MKMERERCLGCEMRLRGLGEESGGEGWGGSVVFSALSEPATRGSGTEADAHLCAGAR
jgi:hypothetical protein